MTLRDFLDVSRLGRLFVLCGVLWLASPTGAHAAPQGEWVAIAPAIATLATGGTLVVLADGAPLLFGFQAAGIQEFLPEIGDWRAKGSLQVSRGAHATATLLPIGVLVVGGEGSAGLTAEVYDPTTDTSKLTTSTHFARAFHRTTLLASGKVLVSGGVDPTTNRLVGPTDIYDPRSGAWALAATPNQPRAAHAALGLRNGRVLIVGGTGASGALASAEVYDPVTEVWLPVSAMDRPRFPVLAVELRDGRILVAGNTDGINTSQIYDPASNSWTPSVPTGGLDTSGLVLLHDGTPMVVSLTAVPPPCGFCHFSPLIRATAAALFDIQTGRWNATAQPGLGDGPVAVLADGRVLLAASPGAQLFRSDNTTPRLTAFPLSVDFGKTSVNVPVQRMITVQNSGGGVLTGNATSGAALTGAAFTIVSGSSFALGSGASASIIVQFNPPSTLGSFTGAVQVRASSNWESVALTAAVGDGAYLAGRVTDTTGAGGAGVNVNLTGAATGSTVTDTTGHYRFFVPPNNGYNIAPVGPGLSFTPTTRSVIVGTQDVSGLDFTATFAPEHIGVFRNGLWFHDLNGNGQWDGCGVDRCLGFGAPGDKPVTGDWTGSGKTKIGEFRNGIWSLDLNGNGQWDGCTVDACPTFGLPGDEPVVGDWAGAGHANIGVFRGGQWFLDLNGNGQWDGCGTDACLGFGLLGDLPVVGDWTGTGDVKIGVFRNGQWFLDRNGNGQWDGCAVDACIGFGLSGDLPVVGDWTGTGQDRIGVFRDGVFFLDLNGNGQWDGCVVDACVGFGLSGDRPVVGFW